MILSEILLKSLDSARARREAESHARPFDLWWRRLLFLKSFSLIDITCPPGSIVIAHIEYQPQCDAKRWEAGNDQHDLAPKPDYRPEVSFIGHVGPGSDMTRVGIDANGCLHIHVIAAQVH